jgi:putative transposase
VEELSILEMNVQEDHVHLVLSIPPNDHIIKIFDRHTVLKKRYWGRHFWAKGYCVSTVGLDEEKICKYVKWQLAKDRRMDQLTLG